MAEALLRRRRDGRDRRLLRRPAGRRRPRRALRGPVRRWRTCASTAWWSSPRTATSCCRRLGARRTRHGARRSTSCSSPSRRPTPTRCLDVVRGAGRATAPVVVAMQNGLGVGGRCWPTRCPERPVLGAMCFICSNKAGPGHVRHLDFGRVTRRRVRRGGGTDGGHRARRRSRGRPASRPAVLEDLDARPVEEAGLEHPVQRPVGGARRRHRRADGRPVTRGRWSRR